jgi:CRISPR-associated protein Cas2
MIIAYDISKNKTRYRVHKILKAWRIDGQKSVHECILDPNRAQELFIQICGDINPKTNSLMMARIEPHRKILYRGIGKERIKNGMVHVG